MCHFIVTSKALTQSLKSLVSFFSFISEIHDSVNIQGHGAMDTSGRKEGDAIREKLKITNLWKNNDVDSVDV